MEQFLAGYQAVIVYEGRIPCNQSNTSSDPFKHVLISRLAETFAYIDRMRHFRHDIDFYGGIVSDHAGLMYPFSKIASGRIEFTILLQFLLNAGRIGSGVKGLISDLQSAAEKWNLIGVLLLKHALLQTHGLLHKTLDNIDEAICMESQLARYMIHAEDDFWN
uniref:Uncharacterized protein n=2 Tax=Paenibacillus athensensis TaxID=1967502 RepID=A0A4Y8QB20_9BACL